MILEHALLTSRGVRLMALVAYIDLDERGMEAAFAKLSQVADSEKVIPFVIPHPAQECAMAGFAAEEWVIDLLEWLVHSVDIESRRHHWIMGLLLGYSPSAIAEHDRIVFSESSGDALGDSVSLRIANSRSHDSADTK